MPSLLSCVGAGALTLLVVLAGSPATALPFAPADLIYLEDFEAEVAFPTTPEIDLVAGGGLTDAPGEPVALGGGEASVALSSSGFGLSQGGAQLEAPSIGLDDVGLRGRFNDHARVPSALPLVLYRSGLAAVFEEIGVSTVVLFIAVDLQESAGAVTGELLVRETDFSTLTVVESRLPLSAPLVAAIDGGAEFTVDSFYDRSAGELSGSLQVDGFDPVSILVVPSFASGSHAFLVAQQLVSVSEFGAMSLDLEDFAVYLPEVTAPPGIGAGIALLALLERRRRTGLLPRGGPARPRRARASSRA